MKREHSLADQAFSVLPDQLIEVGSVLYPREGRVKGLLGVGIMNLSHRMET